MEYTCRKNCKYWVTWSTESRLSDSSNRLGKVCSKLCVYFTFIFSGPPWDPNNWLRVNGVEMHVVQIQKYRWQHFIIRKIHIYTYNWSLEVIILRVNNIFNVRELFIIQWWLSFQNFKISTVTLFHFLRLNICFQNRESVVWVDDVK